MSRVSDWIHLEYEASPSPIILEFCQVPASTFPGSKFKGNVFVGVGAAVTPGFGYQADGIRGVNPAFGGQNETIQTRLLFNPIEFDGIKTGIVQLLPNAEKLDSVSIPHPILNDVIGPLAVFEAGNIGERNEILLRCDTTVMAAPLTSMMDFLGLLMASRTPSPTH